MPPFMPTIATPNATAQSINHVGKRTRTAPVRLSRDFVEYLDWIVKQRTNEEPSADSYGYRESLPWFADRLTTIDVYTRSTEGIIYYLGEIVRRRLNFDSNSAPRPRTVQIKLGPFHTQYWRGICPEAHDQIENMQSKQDGARCYNLFVLNDGAELGEAALSVNYNGVHYWIPKDREAEAKSMHVLSLLKQLLAVNTSAKTLPQTNVISVLSQ